MIVITKAKLKFLRAGRTLTIQDTTGRYRRGREYALGLNHRTQICRVQVLEVAADHIRVCLARIDPPRLLAQRSEHGYTTNPFKALRDEPEAISPTELARYAAMADERARQEHAADRNQQQAKSLAIRLKDAARQNDSTAVRRVQADMSQLAASMDNLSAQPVSFAQPGRGADAHWTTLGRGPNYALTAGTTTS